MRNLALWKQSSSVIPADESVGVAAIAFDTDDDALYVAVEPLATLSPSDDAEDKTEVEVKIWRIAQTQDEVEVRTFPSLLSPSPLPEQTLKDESFECHFCFWFVFRKEQLKLPFWLLFRACRRCHLHNETVSKLSICIFISRHARLCS